MWVKKAEKKELAISVIQPMTSTTQAGFVISV